MKHDTPAVRIASTRPGFWRCGVQHGPEPVVHPAGTFSADEIELMVVEPALIVDVDPGDGPTSGDAGQAGILDEALQVLRAASAAEVEEFARRVSGDPEIRAKLEAAEAAEDPTQGDTRGIDPAVMAALDRLAPDKKPTVKALEEASGVDLDAASRDAAWEVWSAR